MIWRGLSAKGVFNRVRLRNNQTAFIAQIFCLSIHAQCSTAKVFTHIEASIACSLA
jgi:hypothetical protein